MTFTAFEKSNSAPYRTNPHTNALVMCFIIWELHCMLLAFTFPLSELFSAQPLAYVDSPFHQYQVNLAKE